MIDLDAIQARADATSPGPWKGSPTCRDAVVADAKPGQEVDEEVRYYGGAPIGESMHAADREFIAHARTDVPDLVAELRAARDAINLLRPMAEGTPLPDGRATLAAIAAYDKVTGGTTDA